MKTITYCSFKGGTSKTSSCLNLAACLAKFHKKRCLLIDFDPQANLSTGFGVGPDSMQTMVPVLQGKVKITDVIQQTSINNISLISSNVFLDGIEKSSELVSDIFSHQRLKKALKDIENNFDYCFIDTPPSLGWLTQTAFLASQYSLICCIPEAFSILALRRLKECHTSITENGHPLDVLGIVLSLWDDRGSINHALLDEIQASFPDKLFDSKVRRDVAVSRAVLQGKPVTETHPKSRASLDYQALTKELLKRIQKNEIPLKLKVKNLLNHTTTAVR